MTRAKPRVVVIGAGIVGASVTYHLARRGADVTLIDKGAPAAGVTAKSFAWINVSSALATPYARFRHQAVQDWRRLEADIGPQLGVDWCGTLFVSSDASKTERRVEAHEAWGFDIRQLDQREIAALEPGLVNPPPMGALAADEGAVDPVAATVALVAGACRAGARLVTGSEVLGLDAQGNRVSAVRLADRRVPADDVVLAAGTTTPALCAPLGVDLPIDPSAALLLRFRTSSRLISHVVVTPDMELRQDSDTQLLAACGYPDEASGQTMDSVGRRMAHEIGKSLHNGETATLTSVEVGIRPMPSDGYPVIGFSNTVDGLYVAATHSGVTLAPAIGRFAATEIVDRTKIDALHDYRPGRF